ncbi:MAG: hypothetical protein ACOCVM_08685, partial [Desulfovibrionaceae bacterium]
MSRLLKRTTGPLILMLALLVAATCLAGGLVMHQRLTDSIAGTAAAQCSALAALAPDALDGPDAFALQAAAERSAAGADYLLLRSGGDVALAGKRAAGLAPLLKNRPAAQAGSPGKIEMERLSLDGDAYLEAQTTLPGGLVVRVGYSTLPAKRAVLTLCLAVAAAALFILPMAVGLLQRKIKDFTAPIRKLTLFARRVAGHDFGAVMDVREPGEVGELA